MGALPTPVTESGQQGASPLPLTAVLLCGRPGPRAGKSLGLAVLPGRGNQHPPPPGHLLSLLSTKESGQKPFSSQIFHLRCQPDVTSAENSKCKATKWHSVSSDPSCATLGPEGLRSHLLSPPLGCLGKASSQRSSLECGVSPSSGPGSSGPGSRRAGTMGDRETAALIQSSLDCGLVMGLKTVYVVAGRVRGGILLIQNT